MFASISQRMRHKISRWPVKKFYKDEVVDGENSTDVYYCSEVSMYIWVPAIGEGPKDKSMSKYNEREAKTRRFSRNTGRMQGCRRLDLELDRDQYQGNIGEQFAQIHQRFPTLRTVHIIY